jgi:hypothetical protein
VRGGMAPLTLTGPTSGATPARQVFDQSWTIPEPALVADETYQWTVDGAEFELAVSGSSVTRTRGQAHAPVVTLTTTTAVFDSLLAGQRTLADTIAAGDFELTGPPEAIARMFAATGFPAHLLAESSPIVRSRVEGARSQEVEPHLCRTDGGGAIAPGRSCSGCVGPPIRPGIVHAHRAPTR